MNYPTKMDSWSSGSKQVSGTKTQEDLGSNPEAGEDLCDTTLKKEKLKIHIKENEQ